MSYGAVFFAPEPAEKERAIYRMAGGFMRFFFHYVGEMYAFDNHQGRFTKEEREMRAIESKNIALEAIGLDSADFPEAYRKAFFSRHRRGEVDGMEPTPGSSGRRKTVVFYHQPSSGRLLQHKAVLRN